MKKTFCDRANNGGDTIDNAAVKPGPKPRAAELNRSIYLGARFTPAEAKHVRAMAEAKGCTVSDYVRESTLERVECTIIAEYAPKA